MLKAVTPNRSLVSSKDFEISFLPYLFSFFFCNVPEVGTVLLFYLQRYKQFRTYVVLSLL